MTTSPPRSAAAAAPSTTSATKATGHHSIAAREIGADLDIAQAPPLEQRCDLSALGRPHLDHERAPAPQPHGRLLHKTPMHVGPAHQRELGIGANLGGQPVELVGVDVGRVAGYEIDAVPQL